MNVNDCDYKKDNFKPVDKNDLLDIDKFYTKKSEILKEFDKTEKIIRDDVKGRLKLYKDDINGYINMNNLNINDVEINNIYDIKKYTENLILTSSRIIFSVLSNSLRISLFLV